MNAVILRYTEQIICCMAAIVAFSILFHAPRRQYLVCGLSGTIGWIVYCVLTDCGASLSIANFGATVALTMFCRLMAVVRRTPVTVFLVPGIFPLVPGAGIYYTAYYLFMGYPQLGAAKGLETLTIAIAITLGILVGTSVLTRPLILLARKMLERENQRHAHSRP